MNLSEEIIDHLLSELVTFHKETPLSEEFQALYDKTPVNIMIQVLLEAYGDDSKIESAADILANQMLENEIPYAVILGDINFLKQALVRYYKSDDLLDLFETVDNKFERIKNSVAEIFLKECVRKNGVLPDKIMADKALIRIYQDWFSVFQKSVLHLDIKYFKSISKIDQQFLKALQYPESRMMCLDPNACEEIHRIHAQIMRQSKVLYLKLVEHDYLHAYILYNEVQVAVKQLVSLLVTLYYNYETNKIGNFFNFLEIACAFNNRVYLTLLNIQGMKRINALKGEKAGDHTLERVDQNLRELVNTNKEDFVYVQGLDGEFYILSISKELDEIKKTLTQLTDELQTPQPKTGVIQIKSITLFLNYFNSYTPEVFRKVIHEMHRQAAIPHVFLCQKETVQQFESLIFSQLQQSLDIVSFLEQDKVEIVLQPITALSAEEKPLAFEVLGRVRTDKGLLSAGIFIDRVNELGLSATFDLLILKTICSKAHLLREITDTIFINISPVSLNETRYIKQLLLSLENELKELNVVLELTEQTLLTEIDLVKKLSSTNDLVFAIDDFGTGFSSLLTVIDLATSNAVRYLKIDGSLTKSVIANPSIALVFDVISNLSKSLNIYSIAEFIENTDLAQALHDQNITYGQGYYLGRPNSIEYWLVERLSELEDA